MLKGYYLGLMMHQYIFLTFFQQIFQKILYHKMYSESTYTENC